MSTGDDDDNPELPGSLRLIKELTALRDALDPPSLRQARTLADTLQRSVGIDSTALRGAIVQVEALRITSKSADAIRLPTTPSLTPNVEAAINAVRVQVERERGLVRAVESARDVIDSGSALVRAIEAARLALVPSNKFATVIKDLALRSSFRSAVEAAALIRPATYVGGHRVQDLELRGAFESPGNSSDLAHDVDALVDTLNLAYDANWDEPDSEGTEEDSLENRQSATSHEIDASFDESLWLSRTDRVLFRPVQIFCGSASADERYRDALMKHLSVLRNSGRMTIWHDGMLAPGDDRQAVVEQQMQMAQLLLLLISADYMAELYRTGLMASVRAQAQRARIVPVWVRRVDYDRTFLKQLASLPRNGQPVTAWHDPDDAWTDIAIGVREIVEAGRCQAASLIHLSSDENAS